MNTTNLKKYAPQARRDFMAAISQRLNQFGIHADKHQLTISTPIISGSVMQIEGLSFDAGLARAREKLVQRAESLGFEQLVEQMAYTWFNRLSAIRFMELHGYFDHNLRVLSHPDKANSFEILDHAQDVAAELGLDRNQIVELKLAGNKDEQLYRSLLLGQCHQLNQTMPFLFEALDDETELLLPDNLTRTDSILRGLVDSIPEDDWQNVEIIGWLYQFYISEKKDQVIGNVVKSEDIPAATQLFTPNWIVKYLVQNSVGRQWLMTYPDSGLKAQMEYYIEPAEQEPSVVEALAAITPTSIDPETLKVLDPACGSGHILVEAYDILKAIYEERGYRIREIPKLILENNLYGLDIDDRAAQLAGFALMMKAREDDRRIFTRDIKLNVLAIQSTQNLDLPDLWRKLALHQNAKPGSMESIFDDVQSNLADTVDDSEFKQLRTILALFEQSKTLGSLIQVPHEQAEFLQNLTSQLQTLTEQGDTMQKPAAMTLLPYVQQAWLLAEQYDAVVANPPYMGNKYFCDVLKKYTHDVYQNSKADLYGCFIKRTTIFSKKSGSFGMITIPNWMFLSSFEACRNELFETASITSLVHNGRGVFGSDFGSAAFCLHSSHLPNFKATYKRLFNKSSEVSSNVEIQKKFFSNCNYFKSINEMQAIPGLPISYWASEKTCKSFEHSKVGNTLSVAAGLTTGNTNRFLRYWHEIDFSLIDFQRSNENLEFDTKIKYVPYNKGGDFRKWYGNAEYVLKYSESAFEEMRLQKGFRPDGLTLFFKPSITWSKISIGDFSARFSDGGFGFDATSTSAFGEYNDIKRIICALNSSVGGYILNILNSSMVYLPRDIKNFPTIDPCKNVSFDNFFEIAKSDWDASETSWNFKSNSIVSSTSETSIVPTLQRGNAESDAPASRNAGALPDTFPRQSVGTIKAAFGQWQTQNLVTITEMQRLEEENNRLFIEAYGLQDELTPEVPEDQITLTRADQEKDIQRLISYAIGCMMGRYSLDEPGLIYAHAGNIDFDPSRYSSFPADDDGILPLTDQEWFKDDATNRFREFLLAVWGEDSLPENLEFVAESLTLSSFKAKKGETSLDTVRRYLSNQFYKDHLQTYKKRPIYWLFSSGKQKAFECLVYLHRYNDSTLARMRTEYVTPLLGKYSAYADQLTQQLQDASSSEATRIKKDLQTLEKKQTELRQFDDKLKHYADMRIKLDLDDGVKVNYGKFGDLLAEVKAVTGGAGD
jgi:type II restriction/modification system DNA methylase subunit YeeA